nr:transcriptional repressor [Treponema sp.]
MRTGGYNTKVKKLILEFLESKKNTSVSVQNIADYLNNCGEETNITTIYRQLEKLAEEKKLIRHSAEDGK